MKAVVYDALGQANYKSDVDIEKPNEGEVLVRMKASGLCHTDVDVLHGRYGRSEFPIIPGHEYAGVVEEVGANISDFSVGDRVVVDPNIHCGQCSACAKQMYNLCEDLNAYGVTRHGGFAELSIVKTTNLVPAGDLPFDLAALAEPIGCVLTGINQALSTHTKNALIIGAGPIGLLMGLSLRAKGIAHITFIDKQQSRLDFAISLGFSAVMSGAEELTSMQQSFDFTADVTGVPAVAESLISYTANGGSALIFGVCPPESQISISPFEIFRRQITLVGTHSLNHNIAEAIDVIHKIGPDLRKLISHKVELNDIPAFLKNKPKENMMKVQVVI